jgi:hypothetical protein
LKQEENETVAQFVTRLRRAGQDCGYGDDTDNDIRNEVVHQMYIRLFTPETTGRRPRTYTHTHIGIGTEM